MLLLVTIGLVLVAAATLVIGLVSNSLTPIYISIVCSAVAALVLFLFYRLNRGRRAATTGGPLVDTTPPVFSPTGSASAPRRPSDRVVTGATATSRAFDDAGDGADQGPDDAAPPAAPEWPTRRFGRSPAATTGAPAAPSWPPATPPTSRPSRPGGAPTPPPVPAAAPAGAEPPAPPVPAAAGPRPFRRPEPLAVPETPAPGAGPTLASMSSRPAPVSPAGDAEAEAETGSWSDELPFPIEDYDELRVVEIISVLPELDDDELDEVRRYEQEHRGRAAIISRIETLRAGPGQPATEDTAAGAPPPASAAGVASAGAPGTGGPEAGGGGGAENLPIADYDFLGVSEILPLLAELDPDELEDVRAYEADARGRATILFRIDALLAATGGSQPAPEPAAGEPEAESHAPEPEAEQHVVSEAEPQPAPRSAGEFPIADYDRLRVFQILTLLPELDDDELEAVRAHEEANRNRVTILNQINSQLSDAAPPMPPGAGAPVAREPEPEPEAETEPEAEAEPEPEPQLEPEPVGAADSGAADLPIAEYDDLDQWEILPLLDELYDFELEQVRDYEDAHRARVAILRRIDALLEAPAEPPEAGAGAASAGEEPQGAAPPGWEAHEEFAEPEAAEEAAPGEAGPGEAAPAAGEAGEEEAGDKAGGLPIAEYDSLSAFAVLPMLDQLSPDELQEIRDYEDAHRARVTILYRIDKLMATPEPESEGAAEDEQAPPAAAPAGHERPTVEEEPAAEQEPEPAQPAAGAEPSAEQEGAPEEGAEGGGEIDLADLPIAEYDQLMVSEILPLLSELYDDELELVREYEDANLGRVAILARIDALLEEPYEDEVQEAPEPSAEAAGEVEPEPPAPEEHGAEEPEPAGAGGGAETAAEEHPVESHPVEEHPAVESHAVEEHPAVESHAVEEHPAVESHAAAQAPAAAGEDEETFEEDEEFEEEEPPAAAGEDSFPIADYDELRVAEILPLLSQLQPDELEQVARHEQEAGNRSAILNRIERLLRLSPGD